MGKYMEPSTFEFEGLAGKNGQKSNDYDQFLRSNIDNQHDNRNFNDDEGKDHLPFRTLDTEVQQQEGQVDLTLTMAAGEAKLIPLRWNNPHSSEMEVNIWIFPKELPPVVVPIKKPTCIAEGYQDNLIKFILPSDFGDLNSKIPGFNGCNSDTKPMCTVQVYAHSVESLTYAMGFPVIVTGGAGPKSTAGSLSCDQIKLAPIDPGMDLSSLRPLCRPSNDPSQHIQNAVPQWANMFSDVYNHAYQNSDFSAYSGQQHNQISANLQAACVNKMVTGNRGELGRNALPSATKAKIAELQKLEDKVYKQYETYANNIIKRLGAQMMETGFIEVEGTYQKQQLANFFRCNTVGSTNTNRQQTTTYIPSFKLPTSLVQSAKALVPASHQHLITQEGVVQIYVASMDTLMPDFLAAEEYGLLYQPAMKKRTVTTMPDATQFKKRTDTGKLDNGKYAATTAKYAAAKAFNCQDACLLCDPIPGSKKPLIKDGDATCITGNCAGCAALFSNAESAKKTATILSQTPTCVAPLLKNVESENPGWWDSLVSSADRKTSPGLLLQVLAAIVTSVILGVGSSTIS